jgi:hypothetical protein
MARGRDWCSHVCQAAVVRGNRCFMLSSLVPLGRVSAPAVCLSWALDNAPGNAARGPAPAGITNQDRVTNPIAEQRPVAPCGWRLNPAGGQSTSVVPSCLALPRATPPEAKHLPASPFAPALGPPASAGWKYQTRWRDKIGCNAKPEAQSGWPLSPAGGNPSSAWRVMRSGVALGRATPAGEAQSHPHPLAPPPGGITTMVFQKVQR